MAVNTVNLVTEFATFEAQKEVFNKLRIDELKM